MTKKETKCNGWIYGINLNPVQRTNVGVPDIADVVFKPVWQRYVWSLVN